MALEPGTRVGPYEVTAALGAGGMGEVYRARDTKLDRDVALKILPEAFVTDRERLARFRREARLLAALNHPNIAAIYGLEDSGERHALVLELVEGPTLAELLASRQASGAGLPLDEALPIARQIAEALEAAHEQGIIHRDLKPANIKVKDDGTVKVLDFGLAKALGGEGASAVEDSPTITAMATQAGVIMGTAPYMSPEQAKGKTIDKRTDIWALGAVLFEILTGKAAFGGETVAEALPAVLSGTPDWDAIPDTTPFLITRLVRRCLERDRRERIPDAGVARIEIADALTTSIGEPAAGSPGVVPRSTVLAWGVAGLMTICVLTLALLWPATTEAPRPITRFEIQPPTTQNRFILSPDGTRLLYLMPTPDGNRMVIRRLDELEARPIPGVERGTPQFFSPDGEWVGYLAGGELMRVPVTGGTPVPIAELPITLMLGASWGEDGNVYFGGTVTGLWRVSADGGEPEALTTPDAERGELDYHLPRLLPGGEAVIFTLHDLDRRFHIEALSLTTGERTVLIEDAFDARYVSTGHLVYGRGQAVLAAPFSLDALEITGPSVRLVQNIFSSAESGWAKISVTADGTLAYVPAPSLGGRELVWVSRDGSTESLPIDPAAFGESPRLSPDGARVAVAVNEDERSDIWIHDLRDQTQQRVTFEGRNRMPVWSKNGARIAFGSDRAGKENIYWTSVDAGGSAEIVLASGFWTKPDAWAQDGDTLTFTQEDATEASHLGMLRVSDPDSTESLIRGASSRTRTFDSRISPDGRFIAYSSNANGPMAVYVRPYPDVQAAQWQVSASGGTGLNPVWGRDGRELFYRQGRSIVSVPVAMTPTFDMGVPEVLFEGAPEHLRPFDVSPDGRFLMVSRSDEELAPRPIRVVRNWFEELRARVPTP